MKPLSLTVRIGALFALSVAVVLLAAGYLLARSVEGHFVEGDRHELQGKLELVGHLLESVVRRDARDQLPQRLDDALVGHHGLAVAVEDAGGRLWFASSGADFPRVLLRHADCSASAELTCLPNGLRQWRQNGRDYRGLRKQVRAGDGSLHTVVLALDIAHHESFMARFRALLALAMGLAVLATAALGWVAVRRGLAPLRRITSMAASISAERLAERLPDDELPEELQRLAATFNAMLARLDDSFRRLSEFSSDIAHELRTPISNLMTQTQVALGRVRSVEEYQEALQSSAEEYERLARMIGDMLFLAKADNRLIAPSRETVDLAREARDLIEFHGILADESGIRLELAGEATTTGDRIMLRRALSNLLSNAIRHCPPGGTVAIRLEQEDDGALVTVENPGDIPPDRLPRLFDRFYTGDPSRRSGGEGVGLGLAIVRSIVEVHGGMISASADAGIIRFVIRLRA